MKRAPFLGAGAAAFLAGCGGNHLVRALPGAATLKGQSAPNPSSYRLVPETADAIPAAVLASPIIGEARRFDGTAAPAGWMLCNGQSLSVSANQPLFKVLGSIAGGDGKSTFKLPNGRAIIAVSGAFPSSSAVFAQTHRRMLPADSLGEGARPAPPRAIRSTDQKTAPERRLIQNAVRASRANPVRLSQDVLDRIQQGRDDARTAALERLSPSNRARMESAIPAIVDGRTTTGAVVAAIAGSLSDGEAAALLSVNDAMVHAFRADAPVDHSNPRLEAASFLVPVAFTRDQKRALLARESRTWRNG